MEFVVTPSVELTIDALAGTIHFKHRLKQLGITLQEITSNVDKVTKPNQELDRDSRMLTSLIKEAEDLVDKCLKVKWNLFKRCAYSLKLKYVNEKLLKAYQVKAKVDRSRDSKLVLEEVKAVMLRMECLASNMEDSRHARREQEGNELRVPEISQDILGFNESKVVVSDSSVVFVSAAATTSEIQVISEDSYKESRSGSGASSFPGSQQCRHFEFLEIQQATNNFDESLVIGHGGFGKVYKGNVMNGSSHVVVAIKRLDSTSSQGATEFWAEVEILSGLRHCNLVSLIGYCSHGREKILVYEYISNGTLEDHLHRHGTPLSWIRRLKICIGAGRGLHYLHTGTGTEVGVTHRDVKTSNILLHENWATKISDFGLSKTGPTDQPSTYVKTQVRGTFGYLDPDYSYTGKLTRKSDVYAFGVVLLEVLCRRPALDHSLDDKKQNLARWAQESIKEGNLKHIIDSDIRGQISPKCLKEFVRIAKRCLHDDPKKRPTMGDAVGSLESVLSLQEKWSN
ncbi:hypothetical protein OSB04_014751 [Centaurea solstitialis]|uniref:Protein kinase domain-containing protein n=1 Tax=Centaurea solstitialis TaxID=347529 RepID=A0AA38T8W4_9ASTR|nr:hypothetical protein OSB04_014751 [Centaurea solstitialis]